MPEAYPKVAYLSYDGLTDPLGQSQILPYILGLESKGFEFVIFSFEKSKASKEYKSQIAELIGSKRIKWIPLQYHKKPPVLSTLLDLLILWWSVKKEHKIEPFAFCHCRSYVTSLVGLGMKRKRKIKFIFDMRGFWADERVEGGLWNLKNPIFKLVYLFFKRKEKEFLKEADHVISLTHNAKNEIESWQIGNAPISVIPTCVDLDLFDLKSVNEADSIYMRQKLQIAPDEFVLLYLGSWGTWYLTREMLNFFTLIRNQVKAKFLIVTTDNVKLPNEFKYPESVIITSASRVEIPLLISLASASVNFIKNSFSKKASYATKMGEIIAMGRYVVTNSGWGDVDLLSSDQVMVLSDLSMEKMKSAISFTLDNRWGKSFRMIDTHSFSLATGISKYKDVYQKVLC